MRISSAAVLVLLVALHSCEGQNLARMSPRQLRKMLHDRKYVQQQLNCVLDKGECDTIGNQLRIVIPEVLTRNCRLCTPHQAEIAKNVINYISHHFPKEWAEIVGKFVRS